MERPRRNTRKVVDYAALGGDQQEPEDATPKAKVCKVFFTIL